MNNLEELIERLENSEVGDTICIDDNVSLTELVHRRNAYCKCYRTYIVYTDDEGSTHYEYWKVFTRAVNAAKFLLDLDLI